MLVQILEDCENLVPGGAEVRMGHQNVFRRFSAIEKEAHPLREFLASSSSFSFTWSTV